MALPTETELETALRFVRDAASGSFDQAYPKEQYALVERIARNGLLALDLLELLRDVMIVPVGVDSRRELDRRIDAVLAPFA